MKEVVTKEIKAFKTFIDKYQDEYGKEALDFIKKNFVKLYQEQTRMDIMLEIYQTLGMLKKEESLYHGILNIMQKEFDLNTDLLEIGGCWYPAMAELIAQNQTNGSVTVYDSSLVTTSIDNLILYNRDYTNEDEPTNFNLIYGVAACEATELIIKKANANNKDFLVAWLHPF